MSNGPVGHHVDFLRRFAANEAERSNKPVPLTAEEHANNRKNLRCVRYVKPKLADGTMINVSHIFKKWTHYCSKMRIGDWKETIQNLTRETTMDFFLFVCSNYNVKSWGTSEEYMRQFQQLYTNITGRYMDRNDSKEVYKYHHSILVPRFSLRAPNIDGKPVLNADSLRVILSFNMAYDTAAFGLERHRIQLAGCYQILCYTGARPAELVDGQRKTPKDGSVEKLFGRKLVRSTAEEENSSDEAAGQPSNALSDLLLLETKNRGRPKALCYEDIMMMLVRHPETDQGIPVMALRFIHHKGADRKPKPTIFFFTPTTKLIFCAVTTILALALHDQAFDAPSLTDASRVLSTRVWGQKASIPLRWKESMLKRPIFRRIRHGDLSEDEAMLYSKLNYDMARQSLDSGFEKAWTPRFARRGAANAANGDAPDPVRDQMMRHDPKFATFFSAYLNENAQFDLQNAFLEEEKQDQLFKLFAFVSLTRDPRAVRDMVPDEVWANTPPDPAITALEDERTTLKQGSYRIEGHAEEARIRALTKAIRAKRAEREKRIVKEYREYYFYNRPTWDVEAQARGEVEEEYEEPVIDVVFPERARLAELFCHQPPNLGDQAISELRVEAINLMVLLCSKRETAKSDHRQIAPVTAPSLNNESSEPELQPEHGFETHNLRLDSTQCPDCVGDARLSAAERVFRWCRPTVRNDHFDDQHLPEREAIESCGGAIRCYHAKCVTVQFKDLDHFRNHVQSVHGITLRTSHQVKHRRLKKAARRLMTSGSTGQK